MPAAQVAAIERGSETYPIPVSPWNDIEVNALDDSPHLGLATTREILDELRCRIEIDYYAGGGGLDYSTVKGRPVGTLDG